jgi:hypothetical protein
MFADRYSIAKTYSFLNSRKTNSKRICRLQSSLMLLLVGKIAKEWLGPSNDTILLQGDFHSIMFPQNVSVRFEVKMKVKAAGHVSKLRKEFINQNRKRGRMTLVMFDSTAWFVLNCCIHIGH